ncbi:MAG: hypothetical protein M3M85_03875 [bacterium]|nr:hypothetical protein [bacterium]
MITYDESVVLAGKLRQASPAILGVELFGSVQKNGEGRDADFIILVDNELARQWWTKERELIRVRWPDALYEQRWIIKKFIPFIYSTYVHKRRQQRLKNSADMLGIDLKSLANQKGEVPDFELFLFPINWRMGQELNLSLMHKMTDLVNDKNTLGFLERIARDAVAIN